MLDRLRDFPQVAHGCARWQSCDREEKRSLVHEREKSKEFDYNWYLFIIVRTMSNSYSSGGSDEFYVGSEKLNLIVNYLPAEMDDSELKVHRSNAFFLQ